ncbi:hypothetical protein Gasu2_47060 [Galdieria sulphuraria]|uniref:Transcription factor Pcc1 n=1 Tax=Galdieria sulphuraria TaxID=130081 RepID=M2X5F0_GALSU|nr:uncharacterized protein Gasu_10980 [Galdieria sulphuraria]EME31720.1 hypothetical protein Gasu_10980 [Galdieria sulphuraria]GJD10521.1 hypothetical protein Gasu2_47060 [Galdieria sulphuraria]|eukprot:XP_005708240.1 hypothetical protein Gasu_10980 [Galdieria sulphuraria]
MESESSTWPCYEEHWVPFASPDLALVALKSIQADPELRPNQVKRILSVQDNSLHVQLYAKDERALRMALQSLQQMIYVVQTAITWFSTDYWKTAA